MVMYIKLDENGNPFNAPSSPENVKFIMQKDYFTEEELRSKGFATLVNGDTPPTDELHEVFDDGIVKNEDGSIEQKWKYVEITPTEKYYRFVVRRRIFELANSDWTQLADNGLSDAKRKAWAEYRQALRDIPQTQDIASMKSSADVIWPQKPDTEIVAPPPADPNGPAANVVIESSIPKLPSVNPNFVRD